MTDTTNPPIQVLGVERVDSPGVDWEIVRYPKDQSIAWRQVDDPRDDDDLNWHPDPYVALGWLSYDDDGVPTWAGPGSDEYVTVRREDLERSFRWFGVVEDEAVDTPDDHDARACLIAALYPTPAGDAKESPCTRADELAPIETEQTDE